jgi:hypothetical protein
MSKEAQLERRRFGRRATCKPAQIIGAGKETMSCIVVDISESGAKLRLAADEILPSKFELCIEQDDFTVTCRLVHYRDQHAGVEFLALPKKLSWQRRRATRGPNSLALRKATE